MPAENIAGPAPRRALSNGAIAGELMGLAQLLGARGENPFKVKAYRRAARTLRTMDNRYFNILGHATGRLLLKRPGYELDMDQIIHHARRNGCFFEINSSPDRLDLSAENTHLANQAGVQIAISTDAHSTREFGTVRYGIDQARRAGLEPASVLNCLPWPSLEPLFRR